MALIVGLCGGTGSGKTTVAEQIVEAVGAHQAMILHQDHYYLDLSHLPKPQRDLVNFDHPDSLDWDLMQRHLESLHNGQAIEKPVYSFHTHCRSPDPKHVEPCPVIIFEGILAFEREAIRRMLDIKIFVDTDADVRLIRRLQRDVRERGRSLDSVIHQYLSTVRPMHLQFVEPSRRFADLIIPEGGQNRVAIDMVISRVLNVLPRTGAGIAPAE